MKRETKISIGGRSFYRTVMVAIDHHSDDRWSFQIIGDGVGTLVKFGEVTSDSLEEINIEISILIEGFWVWSIEKGLFCHE